MVFVYAQRHVGIVCVAASANWWVQEGTTVPWQKYPRSVMKGSVSLCSHHIPCHDMRIIASSWEECWVRVVELNGIDYSLFPSFSVFDERFSPEHKVALNVSG